LDVPLEARVARIESDVAHLCTDVADIKIDVRGLRERIDVLDGKFDAKLSSLDAKYDAKFEKLTDSLVSARNWAILLYLGLAAAVFGTMARAFQWI
jgi:hypothetical protein